MGQTRQGRGCRGRASTAGFKSCTYKSEETLSQTEFFKKKQSDSPLCGVQFSSVAQLCPTLCDPMDCSTPGLLSITNSQSLLKLMSIELVMQSNHLLLCCALLLLLQSFPASGSFPMNQFFTSRGQSIGVSASASVLPMNIQD